MSFFRMNVSRLLSRMKKEMDEAKANPSRGVSLYGVDLLCEFEATVSGPPDTPYEDGLFHLKIKLGETYPDSPPEITFTTRIFHPNIDAHGKICLDLLEPPPSGTWNANTSIMSVLKMIRLLLTLPNPYNYLCEDIAQLCLNNEELFVKLARGQTEKHAREEKVIALLRFNQYTGAKNDDFYMQPSTSSMWTMECEEENAVGPSPSHLEGQMPLTRAEDDNPYIQPSTSSMECEEDKNAPGPSHLKRQMGEKIPADEISTKKPKLE